MEVDVWLDNAYGGGQQNKLKSCKEVDMVLD